MKYLKYPVNFKSLVRGSQDNFCKIEESIAYNIMMIITTSFGEIPEIPNYGSVIWDLEFNQHIKKRDWEDLVRKSLLKSIAEFERRLTLSEVTISLDEIDNTELGSSIRRKANIVVKGDIIESLMPFSFHTKLNISPISQ
ncbi:GPW/gp25 family protein [Flavobacterium sp. CFS9]|uniref:GPW/gp25 family protein n=1 Tax=Flavobacterium sp. CFS9 TaxID=3143118 RepID=A0AAT9H7A4_9FLAO